MGETDRSVYCAALHAALDSIHLELPPDGVDRLVRHFEAVVEANRKFNLTRITAPPDFAVRHHADSLTLAAWIRGAGAAIGSLLDIGTGAGIPAVPLAVALPKTLVTAIDGTGKKARFVEEVGRELRLNNLKVEHAHSEHWRGGHRIDLVCFKAVGRLDRCLRSAQPFVGVGGCVAVYKTPELDERERSTAEAEAARLGFSDPDLVEFALAGPDEPLRRTLWVFRRRSLGAGGRRRGVNRV